MKMPEPDRAIIENSQTIISDLKSIISESPLENLSDGIVIDEDVSLRAYECDGLSAYCQKPMVVVLPNSTAQISKILGYCHDNGIKVVARGSGTSLSGGALPLEDAVLVGLGK